MVFYLLECFGCRPKTIVNFYHMFMRRLAMKFQDLFKKWGLSSLKLKLKFVEAEFEPTQQDEEAAWAMYVQLITRITTQRLEYGDEKTALDSVYSLFATTREILTNRGRKAPGFTKIAVVVLNQIVRPFTAKWHQLSLAEKAFENPERCTEFRQELECLQDELRKYSALLADVAKVEDITDLCAVEEQPKAENQV